MTATKMCTHDLYKFLREQESPMETEFREIANAEATGWTSTHEYPFAQVKDAFSRGIAWERQRQAKQRMKNES